MLGISILMTRRVNYSLRTIDITLYGKFECFLPSYSSRSPSPISCSTYSPHSLVLADRADGRRALLQPSIVDPRRQDRIGKFRDLTRRLELS